MGSKDREPATSLIERLAADPAAFDFLQAVRLVEMANCRAADPRQSVRTPVGEDAQPVDEALRFHAAATLRFPAAELAAAEDDGGRVDLTVNFMGLTGPSGVLPRFYTEYVVRNQRDRQFAIRDFFDVFNHRLISLFARAGIKYRMPLVFERNGGSGEDPISAVMQALVGMLTPHLRQRLPVDDRTILYYSGHFARSPRAAVVLERMLADFFGLAVKVHQFRGQWLKMAEDERTRLPDRLSLDGQHCGLSVGAVLGERTWDMQGGFRIMVGPVNYSQFSDFMPGRAGHGKLVALTRTFVGPGLDFDVQVVLERGQVPYLRLGGEAGSGREPRLGWNTWLRREVETDNRGDAVFRGRD